MPDVWDQFPDASAEDPWNQFPDAEAAPSVAQPRSSFQHLGDVAGVAVRHPFSAPLGLAENALGSITGGAGSLAEALTGRDPGTFDWAYRPRTQAGQDIARLGGEEAQHVGQQYDRFAGTGPLAQTVKERFPQAMGAVGTVTGLASLRGVGGLGRVPANGRPRPSPVRAPDVVGEAPLAGSVPEAAPAQRPARLAQVREAAPTKAALKEASKAAYKRAEDIGASLSEESFSRAQQTMQSLLENEGLDPALHPDTTAALKRFTSEKGPITFEKLETLRRIAKDAEGSQKPADRRLASRMVDTIDDYAESLRQQDFTTGSPEAVAAIKEARNFYSRARKADELDELVNRAELSAPNFSASGMENALRTEFRNLAKNPRRMRLFTKEEQAAIRKVAKGGPMENVLRMVGKFAPTGALSTAISSGAGFMAGGPGGALALPAIGGAARYAATRMTKRNVARANELVRRGPQNALAQPQVRNALRRDEVQP